MGGGFEMTGIKAILFDLEGTLIKRDPVPEVFLKILRKHGIHVPRERTEEDFPEFMEEMSPESFKLPYRIFWRIYNVKVLEKLGIKGDLERIADIVTDEWWDNANLEVYEDVRETLEAIRQRKISVGIVSNGFQKDIREVLSRTRLEGNFSIIVGVDNVGKPKPHREIFLYALERLKVKPYESIFVGDNPHTDYKGAGSVGIKPLLIDREDVVQGDYCKIRDLRELISNLQEG